MNWLSASFRKYGYERWPATDAMHSARADSAACSSAPSRLTAGFHQPRAPLRFTLGHFPCGASGLVRAAR